MNTKNKIFLDKYVAKFIGLVLNIFVRLLGKILSIDHDLDKPFKTIAISKFKGLGSILQSTPMIHAIRNRYPDAEIIYVSTKSNKFLIQKIDWIDTVIVVDDSSLLKFAISNIKALWTLIKKRPEIYFDLEIYSDYSSIFTTFTLSKNRVGFYLRSSSFRMGLYTHMMFFNPRVPISQVYLQLAQLIDCKVEPIRYFDFPNNNSVTKITAKEYIVINPNASDLRLERRWGKEDFIQLIKMILSELKEYDIILIGAKDEKTYTDEIYKAFDDSRLINTAGQTSLNELIDIIKHAKLMITNDTGPMHIAFCTNIPVVCLFGPCSPEQYGVNENAYIVYHNLYCSPCVHDFEIAPCNGNNQCMSMIKRVEVFDKILMALEGKKDNSLYSNTNFNFGNHNDVFGKVVR